MRADEGPPARRGSAVWETRQRRATTAAGFPSGGAAARQLAVRVCALRPCAGKRVDVLTSARAPRPNADSPMKICVGGLEAAIFTGPT